MEIEGIIEFIESKREYLDICYKMYDIYNGNLSEYLREKLRNDMSGATASEAESRLSAVNILPKVVNKLSKVYTSSNLSVYSRTNVTEVEDLIYSLKMTGIRQTANKMLNLHGITAIEIIKDEEGESLRVLPAHTFLIYSDNRKNPNKVTHFIKALEVTEDREVYALYTEDKYIEFNMEGEIIQELDNEYGVIPFVVLTRDTTELLPASKKDDLEMMLLLPLLLTDCNYALKYQAFSIIYALNTDLSNIELSPNAIWELNSNGGEGDKPEVGSIKPTLSVDDVIKNIEFQFSLYLDTKNIRSNILSHGDKRTAGNISGIAKVIDEADISEDLEYQRDIFSRAEEELYQKIGAINKTAAYDNTSVNIIAKPTIPEQQQDKEDRLINQFKEGLISKVDLIKKLHDFETKEEAENYIRELESD